MCLSFLQVYLESLPDLQTSNLLRKVFPKENRRLEVKSFLNKSEYVDFWFGLGFF